MKAAEMFSLQGRVALVTGASSGLGRQFAKALADNGAAVALVARRADRLKALKDDIEGKGGKAVALEADVTDRAAMVRTFDQAEKAFGTVTILVNNAGIAQSSRRAVEVTEEEWRKVLGVDVDALFYNAQEAARRMLAAKKPGSIVNIASVLGFGVSKGVIAYATAKAASCRSPRRSASNSPSRACASTPSRRVGSSLRSTTNISAARPARR